MAPSRISFVATQSLDTKMMLMNFWFPKVESLASLMNQFCCIQSSSSSAASASLDTSCRNITSAAPVVLMTCTSADIRDFGNDASAFTFQLTRRNEPAHWCLIPGREVLSLISGIHWSWSKLCHFWKLVDAAVVGKGVCCHHDLIWVRICDSIAE
jgi:hypothetical protein